MKIVNDTEYKDNKIKEADDINSLTGGADSKGTLLLNNKTNIYIPNTIQDRQQIIDYINNTIDEIKSIDDYILEVITNINDVRLLDIQDFSTLASAVALPTGDGGASIPLIQANNVTRVEKNLNNTQTKVQLNLIKQNLDSIKQNLDNLYNKLA